MSIANLRRPTMDTTPSCKTHQWPIQNPPLASRFEALILIPSILLSRVRSSVLIISTDPAHNLSEAFQQRFTKKKKKNLLTSLIRGIETTLYTIRALYSAVIAYTPIPELTLIIVLVSSVLAIAEASVPDSVDSQPYLLTVAGLIGFAAVRDFISELSFWTLLLGLFGFARFVKKRDYVSSVLPVAAVLAAVGEPWVRFVVMTSYLALAITHHHSKKPLEDEDEGEAVAMGRKVPVPLLCAAMAIGVRVAAKWAGYRHLTWMIV